MRISKTDIEIEEKNLKYTTKIIREKISSLSHELFDKEEKMVEFKRYMWDNKKDFDPAEMRTLRTASELEAFILAQRGKYFRNLYKIQKNPYFGSIIFKSQDELEENIYIGITYLEDEETDRHLIYDWRSPICSLFYDYDLGPCEYIAPKETIKGELKRKRQYKIEDGRFVRLFDNSMNIDDELLQEVLATESSEKMKNIVNTIQQEQNKIIRNTEDKNLIVQGIAGSGKTSVALHRIAFLLYKLENLSSNNVLIFSPNNIFTEYISNVLPELGEDNTMQTTFHEFLLSSIIEYKEIESFTDFIGRYYTYKEKNSEIVRYKQSDAIIKDIENYIKNLVSKIKFIKGIAENGFHHSISELNTMLHNRYSKLLLLERIDEMAIKLSETNYDGRKVKTKTYRRLLLESLNIKINYKELYSEFFMSEFTQIKLTRHEIKKFVNTSKINYEDACLFVYLKGLLAGFNYNGYIKEIVIDEAQDYSKLQYIIITKIFRKSGFTILGDINQTINPYYKYNSLAELSNVFGIKSRYLELTKTYRSSQEIIEYSNSILGLTHVSAIRNANSRPVLKRSEENNLKELLTQDITMLQKCFKSIAVITKDNNEAEYIYNLLKTQLSPILINGKTENFCKDLIVVSAYLAKGLEFDAVIVYNRPNNLYLENEKYLYYVACTRAQHQLIVYN